MNAASIQGNESCLQEGAATKPDKVKGTPLNLSEVEMLPNEVEL